MANNNPNPNSGGKPPSMKDRLIQVEVKLDTILVNERTIYDEMTKLKSMVNKIATVVDQHSQALGQLLGGQTQVQDQAQTPMPAAMPQAAPPRGQDDLASALAILGPVLEYLTRGKGDNVTNELVGAALKSAVETLKAGPLLVQSIAAALGGSFGKSFGREAGHKLAENITNNLAQATAEVAAEVEAEAKEGGEDYAAKYQIGHRGG